MTTQGPFEYFSEKVKVKRRPFGILVHKLVQWKNNAHKINGLCFWKIVSPVRAMFD